VSTKNRACLKSTAEERLMNKRNITEAGCWEFTGYVNNTGYGMMGYGKNNWLTHRISYEIFVGLIPEGLVVCHTCDNPPCFNPEHLFIGTMKDNMQDMQRKGRTHIMYSVDNPNTRLTPKQILEIKKRHIPTYPGGRGSNTTALAKEYGVSRQYIGQIIAGEWRKNG